jgi:hypothetical protein
MARERERESTSRKGGGGVSLEAEDKISVGLFGPGPAKIVESIFAEYNYGGKSKAVPVWLITYDRDGEKGEQPYSVGSGWRVSSDGESLIPKNGQTGLPDSCNAILLLDSLRKAGLAKGFMSQHGNNPRCLEGKHLKGQENAVELAELCASDDFLSLEKSWSVNAKKGVVSLD